MFGNAPVDRRVRRTRYAVPSALFALLLEKEYDAITVQDIIERADIVRSTFYAHFADKDDVLQQGVSAVRDWARHSAPPGLRFGFSEPLYRHCCQVRPALYRIGAHQTWSMIQGLFVRILGELIREDLDASTGTRGDANAGVLIHLITSAWLSVMTWSLEVDREVTPEELERLFRAFALPGVDAVLSGGRS